MACGERVLLAAEPGHEPAAADEPPVFEPAQRPLQVAPREAQRIVDREVAEHDAPPLEQQLGDRFRELVAVEVGAGFGDRGGHERPAARPRRRDRGGPSQP